jgi:hypothetical protein
LGWGPDHNRFEITISPVTNSRRDEHGDPGFQINDLLIQLQFPLPFEDIINFGCSFMVMLDAIKDVSDMNIYLGGVSMSNHTNAFTTEAMNHLRSIFYISNEMLGHEPLLPSQLENRGEN